MALRGERPRERPPEGGGRKGNGSSPDRSLVSPVPDPGTGTEVTLSTRRLLIEPLRTGDAPELYAVLRDPRIYAFLPEDPPPSVDVLRSRFERWTRGPERPAREVWINWTVRTRAEGKAVGTLQATIFPTEARALIAYVLSPDLWGQGYAQEGVRALVDWLFSRQGIRHVEALVDRRNDRSLRLLHRLGFEHVGTEVKADHFKGGWSDEHRLSLSLARWNATSPSSG